jgi:hypothetical protein
MGKAWPERVGGKESAGKGSWEGVGGKGSRDRVGKKELLGKVVGKGSWERLGRKGLMGNGGEKGLVGKGWWESVDWERLAG